MFRIIDTDIPDPLWASFAERLCLIGWLSKDHKEEVRALTVSSCLMHSMVASNALVPRVASSSTAFTVFRRDVTLVTMTCQGEKRGMRTLTVRPGGGALSPLLQIITLQNYFFASSFTDSITVNNGYMCWRCSSNENERLQNKERTEGCISN